MFLRRGSRLQLLQLLVVEHRASLTLRLDLSGRVGELTHEASGTRTETQKGCAELSVRQVVAHFLGQRRANLFLIYFYKF